MKTHVFKTMWLKEGVGSGICNERFFFFPAEIYLTLCISDVSHIYYSVHMSN